MKRFSQSVDSIRAGSVLFTPKTLAIAALGLMLTGVRAGATILYWYSIGPQPVNTILGFNPQTLGYNVEADSGRVTSLAVDPSNPSHWLIGTAQGGVWENTNAGPSYPRTDSQASLAVGAVAYAPGNPSVAYAGTGEANFRGDDYAGAGLLMSADGGTDWQMINTNFAKTSFSHIAVNPASAANLVVTTVRGGAGIGEEASGNGNVPGAPPRGVFVSSDGGATFARALTGEATALAANPANFNQQYAGLGEIYGDPTNGVYRTTDQWQTFQLISGPWIITNISYVSTNFPIATNVINGTNVVIYTNLITGTNITTSAGGRVALAESPSAPNVLYVGVAQTRSRYLAALSGIWMTTNAWDATPAWTLLPFPPVDEDFVSTPRFWYMFDLLVDPDDPGTLYLAEFNVWRYAAGAWTSLADWSADEVHPDNHVMQWVPKGGGSYSMLLGNDGGLYLSDPGVTGLWFSFNSGLRITQFYKGAVDPTGANVLALGGAQDNFTSLYTGGAAWTVVGPGDGGDCAIAAFDPLHAWAMSLDTETDDDTFPNEVSMLRTLDAGANSTFGANGITDGLAFSKQFYVHFEKAPYDDNLLIAGTARLWRCNNYFSGTIPSWSPNSPTMLDASNNPVPISAMAFAPSDTNGLIYAFGTEDGRLFVTPDGGIDWFNINPGSALPNRYVSGLAFSPANASVLYVTLSGFDESTPGQPGHLFMTPDAFSASPVWTNVSPPVDLPNNCVAIDPNNALALVVGTDIGVWESGDGGSSWTHDGPANGLPNVAVYDLRFNAASQLTAFTHGRGAYLRTKFNIPILTWLPPNFHPTPNCLTCPPDQNWVNPGDLERAEITLQNIVPVDTVNLTATLLPAPGITPITGTATYGVVAGQGPAVTRSFEFIAGAGSAGGPNTSGTACGDTVQLVLQLQDQGAVLGQITIPYRLGVPSHPLVEDFEEQPPPALAPGWTSAATGADPIWTTTTNAPANLPDLGEDEFPPPPSTNTCAFVPDVPAAGQSYLTSPPFTVATPQAQLYFRESFALSNAVDGGILEIAIGSQGFREIVQAGGSFVQDGYNATLSDRNPLGPRAAWTGDSGGWLPVLVNLPPAAAGQTVQLRWHLANAFGLPEGGWYVDSVLLTEPDCLPPITNPLILNPALTTNYLTFAINTVSNRVYAIEYTTNLLNAAWQTFETITGTGSQQVISVPTVPDNQRFYRFEVQ